MKHAIYALTRGYKTLDRYSILIRRNRAIKEFYLSSFPNKKMILFHEGNIPKDHQDYIQEESCLEIEFIPVEFIDKPVKKLGYKNMCFFHACRAWDYLKEYDAAFRIDEDCVLLDDVLEDPMGMISKVVDFVYFAESEVWHRMTLKTLYMMSRDWFIKTHGEGEYYKCKISGIHYYNNVQVYKPSFFFSPSVSDFLRWVEDIDGVFKYRWGDSPILAFALRMFGEYGVHYRHVKYWHGSQNRNINA